MLISSQRLFLFSVEQHSEFNKNNNKHTLIHLMLEVGAEDVDDKLHFCFNFAFNRGISVIASKKKKNNDVKNH